MWIKKNDHAPRSECADFFQCMSKKGIFERKKIQDYSLSCQLLGFTWLHFLLNVAKRWLANLLTTIFTTTKKMSDFIFLMFNVIYMCQVPCIVH